MTAYKGSRLWLNQIQKRDRIARPGEVLVDVMRPASRTLYSTMSFFRTDGKWWVGSQAGNCGAA
jgi:hypothetical protein